jgi:hypothetical protein
MMINDDFLCTDLDLRFTNFKSLPEAGGLLPGDRATASSAIIYQAEDGSSYALITAQLFRGGGSNTNSQNTGSGAVRHAEPLESCLLRFAV